MTVGDDGVFVIDDELAPLSAKLKAALAALSKKPVRFVVNTHWHADHTGGNPALAAAGAVIVAQENVRKRCSVDQVQHFMGQTMTTPALPPAALPVLTFTEDVTLHLNGDEVHVIHVPAAHTDGDSIVHFKKANVIHTGDALVDGLPAGRRRQRRNVRRVHRRRRQGAGAGRRQDQDHSRTRPDHDQGRRRPPSVRC